MIHIYTYIYAGTHTSRLFLFSYPTDDGVHTCALNIYFPATSYQFRLPCCYVNSLMSMWSTKSSLRLIASSMGNAPPVFTPCLRLGGRRARTSLPLYLIPPFNNAELKTLRWTYIYIYILTLRNLTYNHVVISPCTVAVQPYKNSIPFLGGKSFIFLFTFLFISCVPYSSFGLHIRPIVTVHEYCTVITVCLLLLNDWPLIDTNLGNPHFYCFYQSTSQ